AVTIGLGLAEVAMRFFAPQWSDQWQIWHPHPRSALTVQPNVKNAVVHGVSGEFAFRFSTNAQGLRSDHDLKVPKPKGRERYLFVGDSFTFGYGVEQHETFSARLQSLLDPSHSRIEVVNAGFTSGFTLDTEYVFTREEGSLYEPDLVVAGICLSNDSEDLASTRWQVEDSELFAVEKLNAYVPTWIKRSGLINFIRRGVLPQARAALNPSTAAPVASPTLVPACEIEQENYAESLSPTPLSREIPRLDGNGSMLDVRERAQYVAHAWAADAVRKGYRLRFLFIPDREEVEGLASPQRLAQLQQSRAMFREAAHAAGIPIWDPTLALRAAACGGDGPFYFPIDGHWNAKGHRFAADFLAKKIDAIETSRPTSKAP
ncbi:MAG: SGNH/GDSL hydrolase family protein, partial [Burkholderiaceae bacterium]